MKKYFSRLFLYLVFCTLQLASPMTEVTFAQAPSIQWAKCYGGSHFDDARAISQTSSGDYFVAGYTDSNDSDVSGLHSMGTDDFWIIKIDSLGNLLGQKCLGGTAHDACQSIASTMDGGCIAAGWTFSLDGDVIGNHGNGDYWVIKFDSSGSLEWKNCYGGTIQDEAFIVIETKDGGFAVAGTAGSGDGQVIGQHGIQDYWLVKLDTSGGIEWAKTYGGFEQDWALSVKQTFDGGFIMAGYSNSDDGDVTGNHGSRDCWIVKTDSVGTLQWEKSYGSTGDDYANSIIQTSDSGYIFAAQTGGINDGDISTNHGNQDFWLVKLDTVGNMQWQKCLGGSLGDIPYSIIQIADGGYVVAGYSGSVDGDVSGGHGNLDYWIVKTDSAGSIEWQECLGGTNTEIAYDIKQTIDSGFIIAGSAKSNNGDVSDNNGPGQSDFWIVKLSPPTPNYTVNTSLINLSVYPSPAQKNLYISSNIVMLEIKITDLPGHLVQLQSIKNKNAEIDVERLAQGIYFLEVETDQGITARKFVKE